LAPESKPVNLNPSDIIALDNTNGSDSVIINGYGRTP
jgi:hypothetical protein